MTDLRQRLRSGYLLLDGAMGTQLQAAGLKLGELPELLCFYPGTSYRAEPEVGRSSAGSSGPTLDARKWRRRPPTSAAAVPPELRAEDDASCCSMAARHAAPAALTDGEHWRRRARSQRPLRFK